MSSSSEPARWASTAALALATYGVRVHAVSKWHWLANTPRAHITNQRAMEVLRDLGVEEEAKQYAIPWELIGDTTFATSFGGPEIARLQTWGTGDDRHGDYVQGSPCPLIDLIQPLMERVLVTNAAQRGARFSFNTEYLGHEQDDSGVTVTLRTDLPAASPPGGPGTWSVQTVPAPRSLMRSGWTSSDSTPEPARSTPCSTPTSASTSHTGRASSTTSCNRRGFGEIGMGVLRAVRAWDEWMAGWGFDMTR